MKRRRIVLIIAVVLLICSVPCIHVAAKGKIYWADRTLGKIQGANLDGTGVENLVIGLSNSYGMALDMSSGKIYWGDYGTGKIQRTSILTGKTQRANLDGTDVEDLFSASRPSKIALDVSERKIYWVRDNRRIKRSNLDGTGGEEDVAGNYRLVDIALDLSERKIYWTNGYNDSIYRANLDDTESETVLTPHLVNGMGFPNAVYEPRGIALDMSAGKIYWTNDYSNSDAIYRANNDGTHVEELLTRAKADALGFENAMVNPTSIDLDVRAEKMYWIGNNEKTIYCANLDGTNIQEIFTGNSVISDIILDVPTGYGTFSELLVVSQGGRQYEDLTKQHGGDVRSVAYSPWGVVLASGGTDNTMRLWRTTNGEALATYSQHSGNIDCIAFSPNDTWIATGSNDGTLRLWKWNKEEDTWVEAQELEIEGNPLNNNVLSVAFSHDNTMLACGTSNNDVLLWDYNPADDAWVYRTAIKHDDNVNSVAFRPGSNILASASDDDMVLLSDARAGEVLTMLIGHTADVNSVAFSRDGTRIVTGSDDGTVIVWEAWGNTWRYKRTVSSFYGNVNSVAFSPTDNAFAMGCEDGAVLLCDLDSGAILPLERHNAKVRSIAFSRDGKVLASGSSDGKVRQWVIREFSSTYGLEIPDNMVWQPAQSAASTYFFFGARVSSLTGAPHGADIEYEECTIQLHIPDQALYFVLPVTTQTGRKIKAGEDVGIAIINVLGALPIPKVSQAASAIGAIIAVTDAYDSIVKAFGDDLKVTLPSYYRERPDTSMPFIVMTIPRMDSISVTVKQVVKVNGGKGQTVIANRVWDLSGDASAAPIAKPSALKDWSPFQLLSPEGQEVLLKLSEIVNGLTRSTVANLEAWRVPEETSLLANYPNPFNPETWIPYQLTKPADVRLTIYDINGHVVRDLDLGHQRAGIYRSRNRAAHWDGKNTQGESVASGVYFYTLTAGDFTATRKMLIRK